jgi:hypothetical protein
MTSQAASRESRASAETYAFIAPAKDASRGQPVSLSFACSDEGDVPRDSPIAEFRLLGPAKATVSAGLRRVGRTASQASTLRGHVEVWQQVAQPGSATLVISARHLALKVEPSVERLIDEPSCALDVFGRTIVVRQYQIVHSERDRADTKNAAHATIVLGPSRKRYLTISATSPHGRRQLLHGLSTARF